LCIILAAFIFNTFFRALPKGPRFPLQSFCPRKPRGQKGFSLQSLTHGAVQQYKKASRYITKAVLHFAFFGKVYLRQDMAGKCFLWHMRSICAVKNTVAQNSLYYSYISN
jgi:hypothetical protein